MDEQKGFPFRKCPLLYARKSRAACVSRNAKLIFTRATHFEKLISLGYFSWTYSKTSHTTGSWFLFFLGEKQAERVHKKLATTFGLVTRSIGKGTDATGLVKATIGSSGDRGRGYYDSGHSYTGSHNRSKSADSLSPTHLFAIPVVFVNMNFSRFIIV